MQFKDTKYAVDRSADQGFILITVLLLLSILSLSAYLAIERSQFSIKANHNRLSHLQARHYAEESRRLAVPLLQALVFEQDPPAVMTKGMTLHALPSLLNPLSSVATTAGTQQRIQKNALLPFLSIRQTTLNGEVFVQALPSQLNTQGVSLVQHMAYQGPGQGLGSKGSFSKLYELRAKGLVLSRGTELSYWSASDYRFVP